MLQARRSRGRFEKANTNKGIDVTEITRLATPLEALSDGQHPSQKKIPLAHERFGWTVHR